MFSWRLLLALLSVSVGLYAASWSSDHQQHSLLEHGRPNIVMILTDDQDLHMNSLDFMPQTRRLIADHGTTFSNHFCTVALCCPSRVSLWTGKAAHNTNVTDVNPPHGGYPKFISQGFNDDYLPLWLQDAGYSTYYVGKLFNAQKVTNYNKPFAAGWTGSDFLLDPYTYEYYNATFQRNHDDPVSYERQYSTDIVASKAHGFLDDAAASKKPFLLTVAPVAPHSNVQIIDKNIHGNYSGASAIQSPPRPAERHQHLFEDARVPRTPSFNPDETNGVAWMASLSRQNATNIEYNDEWYRNRLRSLQSVDEMVEAIVAQLDLLGILDNTYIIYTTDNGYHVGQHRLQPGKQCAYKEDINIPFMIRGPGVPRNHTTNHVSSHNDIASTFLEIAGAPERDGLDGQAMPLTRSDMAKAKHNRQEHVNVEMWGIVMSEGQHGADLHHNHTYKALRVIGDDYNYLYTVWCNGDHELYDLVYDPSETHNILATISPDTKTIESSHAYEVGVANLTDRLDALLVVLKGCKARSCTHPWDTLHPSGDVHTLADALRPTFDAFYASQEKLHWKQCEQAYIAESEGPNGISQYMEHEVAA